MPVTMVQAGSDDVHKRRSRTGHRAAQGAEGAPKVNDKGWKVMGPLGAVQRTIVSASRCVSVRVHE